MLLRKLPTGTALYLLGKWNKFKSSLRCYDPDPSVMSIIIRGNGDLPDKILEGGKLDYYPVKGSYQTAVNNQTGNYARNLNKITDMIIGENLRMKDSDEFLMCYGLSWRGSVNKGFSESMDSLLGKNFNQLTKVKDVKAEGVNWGVSIDMLMLSNIIPLSKTPLNKKPKGQSDQTITPKEKSDDNEIFRPIKAVIRSEKRKVHTIRSRRSKASIAVGHITHRKISL